MVVKTENVPSTIAWRDLEQANIESPKDIWVIVLSIRASNRSLQRACQVVTKQCVGWLGEVCTMEDNTPSV